MKRILSLLLVAILCMFFTACSNEGVKELNINSSSDVLNVGPIKTDKPQEKNDNYNTFDSEKDSNLLFDLSLKYREKDLKVLFTVDDLINEGFKINFDNEAQVKIKPNQLYTISGGLSNQFDTINVTVKNTTENDLNIQDCHVLKITAYDKNFIINGIQPSVTTKGEILDRFGKPNPSNLSMDEMEKQRTYFYNAKQKLQTEMPGQTHKFIKLKIDFNEESIVKEVRIEFSNFELE